MNLGANENMLCSARQFETRFELFIRDVEEVVDPTEEDGELL